MHAKLPLIGTFWNVYFYRPRTFLSYAEGSENRFVATGAIDNNEQVDVLSRESGRHVCIQKQACKLK